MNKVILQGRLTADPDIRFTPSGTAVCSFTMAVNRKFKDANGERKADFVKCIAWRKTAELAGNYLKKGFRVGVVGSWFTDNYTDQEGKKIYKNECLVDELDLIDFESQNGANSSENNQSNTNTAQRQQNSNFGQNEQFSDAFGKGQIDISDDDLPF